MLHGSIFVASLKFLLCWKLILNYSPQGGGEKPPKQILLLIQGCVKQNLTLSKDKLLPQGLQTRKGQEFMKRAGSRELEVVEPTWNENDCRQTHNLWVFFCFIG